MKMILMFCALIVVAVGVEVYLYHRYVRPLSLCWARWVIRAILYLIGVAMAATATGMVWLATEPWFMATTIWVVWTFLLVLIPSTVFALFSWVPFGWVRWVGGGLAVVIVVLMVHGATWGRTELRVERITIFSDRLPEAFDGLTIAQFSDVHLGNWGSQAEFIEELVARINAEAPDFVVQSGDLVNVVPGELNPYYAAQFSQIEAPVYAVLGNHDLGFYVRDTTEHRPWVMVRQLVAAQEAMGWRVLENEGEWFFRAGDSILIAGVTHPNNLFHNGSNSRQGGSDLKKATKKAGSQDFVALIAHSPALADSIPEVAWADVVMSGHVHAMQAKFELWGHEWSPAEMLYPKHSGLYQLGNGSQLYINDGIGFVLYPMRIGAKPELTLFTLKKGRGEQKS